MVFFYEFPNKIPVRKADDLSSCSVQKIECEKQVINLRFVAIRKSVNSLMYQKSGALVTFYDDIKFLTSNGLKSCQNVPSYINATNITNNY